MRAEYLSCRGRTGLLATAIGVLVLTHTFAQTATVPTQTSGSSSVLAAYQQEKAALQQERQALVSQGATPQQLKAWRQQNASQFTSLQQLAQQMSLVSALQPIPLIQQVTIPADASTTLQDFLVTRASLANAHAQIHNQLLQSLPPDATAAQIQAMQEQEEQAFRQQNAGNLQLQAQRAQTLAAESASQPAPIPGPTFVPPGATPQLQAYLTARDSLMTERAQLWNQYLTADPATRQTAMDQWRRQNASRLQQLRQLASNLANSTP